jgi:hypothetical protein
VADLTEIRARAAARDADLTARATFWHARDLAARWGCSVSSVLAIPRERLAYTTIGAGQRRPHRRYNPTHVLAYEAGRESAA